MCFKVPIAELVRRRLQVFHLALCFQPRHETIQLKYRCGSGLKTGMHATSMFVYHITCVFLPTAVSATRERMGVFVTTTGVLGRAG